MMCADLVDVCWVDRKGQLKRTIANLEDISESGVCLQVDEELPLGTEIHISYPNGDFAGTVKYCVYREIGFFLGIQFGSNVKWNQKRFHPQYMFDPRKLVEAEKESRELSPAT